MGQDHNIRRLGGCEDRQCQTPTRWHLTDPQQMASAMSAGLAWHTTVNRQVWLSAQLSWGLRATQFLSLF